MHGSISKMPMKHSCGAILYTKHPISNKIGIILGFEGIHWLPFKGCAELGETFEEAAIREIREETCGLVNIDAINLEHSFGSKTKHYHIGICYVDYDIIDKFDTVRTKEQRPSYKEKKRLTFFELDNIRSYRDIHPLTYASIEYYWDKLHVFPGIDANTHAGRLRKQYDDSMPSAINSDQSSIKKLHTHNSYFSKFNKKRRSRKIHY